VKQQPTRHARARLAKGAISAKVAANLRNVAAVRKGGGQHPVRHRRLVAVLEQLADPEHVGASELVAYSDGNGPAISIQMAHLFRR
jgi:hypothetical protein